MGHQLPSASVSKRVFVQNPSNENKFDLHENEPGGNSFSYEWFRMKIHFDTEAKGNSEMSYLLRPPDKQPGGGEGGCLYRLTFYSVE